MKISKLKIKPKVKTPTVVGYYHIKEPNKKWLKTYGKAHNLKASRMLDTILDNLRAQNKTSRAA